MAEVLDYNSACSYIEETSQYGSRPGLERIRSLCAALGDPQNDLRFVHIAGTNGKGSTGAMIASVLTEAGLRTGMYYSPAMTAIYDHYMVDGRLITGEEYADAVSAVAAANEKLRNETGESATQFEIETAVAFLYFKEKGCDVVVLECGMGGAEDATNIAGDKMLCVITSISLDHMQYLGNSTEEIAKAKAGIITSPCPVVTLDADDKITDVIKNRCETVGATLYTVSPASIVSDDISSGITVSCCGLENADIPLSGTFQAENAALAIQALKIMGEEHLIDGRAIDDNIIRSGLQKVKWPYRFECISEEPLVIVDGAHNEDAAAKLAASIRTLLKGRRIIIVAGVFADKEYEKIIRILAGTADCIVTVRIPDNPRALPSEDLAACAGRYCKCVIECRDPCEGLERALDKAEEYTKAGDKSAIVACGSLSYLADFAGLVEGIG